MDRLDRNSASGLITGFDSSTPNVFVGTGIQHIGKPVWVSVVLVHHCRIGVNHEPGSRHTDRSETLCHMLTLTPSLQQAPYIGAPFHGHDDLKAVVLNNTKAINDTAAGIKDVAASSVIQSGTITPSFTPTTSTSKASLET